MWRPEREAEYASFVYFGAEIDDGEAMTCALTVHRSGVVVTDDRKTRRVLSIRAPQLIVITTSQVVKFWAELNMLDKSLLRATLSNIKTRPRFAPGKADPLFQRLQDAFWNPMA